MAPKSYSPYSPADNSVSSAVLPEDVYGYIDIATLSDIHRYLCESGSLDDIKLAGWIEENYLYKGTNESSALIRTTEGFSQLDRAYRRVRSLTNKAQDKWPFFDRNFKQMSSTTVRNNARGEAAPGVMYPNDQARGVSSAADQRRASSGLDGSKAPQDFQGPTLQVPFGTNKPGLYRPLAKNEFRRPTRQTPVPLPGNLTQKPESRSESEKRSVPSEHSNFEQVQTQNDSTLDLPKYTEADSFSEPDGQAVSLSGPPQLEQVRDSEMEVSRDVSEVPAPTSTGGAVSNRSGCDLVEDQDTTPVRDAGGGKARGPNGRYLPRDNPSPVPKPSRKFTHTSQNLKKRETVPKAEAPEERVKPKLPTPTENDNVSAALQSPSLSEKEQAQSPSALEKAQSLSGQAEAENTNGTHGETVAPIEESVAPSPLLASASASVTSAEQNEEVSPKVEPTPAYLAALSDAVPSNLDKLPPNSRRPNKRKSEPMNQASPRKRGPGRPRKSEQLDRQAGSAPPSTTEVEGMVTRRSARRSAAAGADFAPKQEPASDPAPDEAKNMSSGQATKPNKTTEDEDVVMNGVEEDTVDDHLPNVNEDSKIASELSASLPATKHHSQYSEDELLDLALNKTSSPAPPPRSFQIPSQSEVPQQNAKVSSSLTNGTTATNASTTTNGTTLSVMNGSTPHHPPGHVEIIARITTLNGTIELPIAPEHLNKAEEAMIQKYAQYQLKPNAKPISYEHFCDILVLAL